MNKEVLKIQENIINELDKVKETLSFCCGEKYKNIIDDRLKEISIYVYSDDLDEDRLKKIDLLNVARDFAKDFTYDLNLDEDSKSNIELYLGKVLLNLYFAHNRKAVTYAEEKIYATELIGNIKELTGSVQENVDKMFFLVEKFTKDFKVRSIESALNENEKILNDIGKYSAQVKMQVLNDFFSLKITDLLVANYLWEKTAYFKKELTALLDEGEFKDDVIENQAKFCKFLGAKGDSYYAIINDAKNKGLIPSSEKIYNLERIYNTLYKEKIKAIMKDHSNIYDIFTEVNKKGIDINQDYLMTYLFSSRNLLGIQLTNSYGNPSCIIFYDKESIYSNIFMDTYFHEVIHYIGGNNPAINKYRLIYNSDLRYACLDEAFTNYLAKVCCNEYFKNNTYFNDILSLEDTCAYNQTLDYMHEVFRLYKDELLEIHFSSTLSLQEACKKCPLEDIANSVYRIKNASEQDAEMITEEEVKKLIKRRK